MSHFSEYHASLKVVLGPIPGPFGPYANKFYTFLFAAIRAADTDNLHKLELVFPSLVQEFKQRYKAGGGALNKPELDFYHKVIERE